MNAEKGLFFSQDGSGGREFNPNDYLTQVQLATVLDVSVAMVGSMTKNRILIPNTIGLLRVNYHFPRDIRRGFWGLSIKSSFQYWKDVGGSMRGVAPEELFRGEVWRRVVERAMEQEKDLSPEEMPYEKYLKTI